MKEDVEKNGGRENESEENEDDHFVREEPDHSSSDERNDDAREMNHQVITKCELRRSVAIGPVRKLPDLLQHVQREGEWEKPDCFAEAQAAQKVCDLVEVHCGMQIRSRRRFCSCRHWRPTQSLRLRHGSRFVQRIEQQ